MQVFLQKNGIWSGKMGNRPTYDDGLTRKGEPHTMRRNGHTDPAYNAGKTDGEEFWGMPSLRRHNRRKIFRKGERAIRLPCNGRKRRKRNKGFGKGKRHLEITRQGDPEEREESTRSKNAITGKNTKKRIFIAFFCSKICIYCKNVIPLRRNSKTDRK